MFFRATIKDHVRQELGSEDSAAACGIVRQRRRAVKIVVMVPGHVRRQSFRGSSQFQQCLADRLPLRPRQIVNLRFHQAKLVRLQLWQFVDDFLTIDEVVFAEPGDMTLLGARTLEGLSLVVDPRGEKLVAAGPLPAA